MTDAPATNELLALADRMETHVVSRLPGSEPVVTNGAWQMMLDAAKALRAAATPSAQGAEVSVEELAREIEANITFDINGKQAWANGRQASRALLGKYRMEKR